MNKKFLTLSAACLLSVSVLLTGCSSSKSSSSDDSASTGAQTYTASATGMESDVSVTITVEDGQITACTIDASGETEGVGTTVPDALESVIVENQGQNIDTVAGATVTSTAAIDALNDCLSQAGLAE